jgi:hypothetical protein
LHGVPEHLDLQPFLNAELERIDLGQFIVHLHFASEVGAQVSIEGDWELRSPDGSILDQQIEPAIRDCYRLHVLLGRAVSATEVHAPDSFLLRFDSGHTLRIFDNSREYESFSVQPGNYYV